MISDTAPSRSRRQRTKGRALLESCTRYGTRRTFCVYDVAVPENVPRRRIVTAPVKHFCTYVGICVRESARACVYAARTYGHRRWLRRGRDSDRMWKARREDTTTGTDGVNAYRRRCASRPDARTLARTHTHRVHRAVPSRARYVRARVRGSSGGGDPIKPFVARLCTRTRTRARPNPAESLPWNRLSRAARCPPHWTRRRRRVEPQRMHCGLAGAPAAESCAAKHGRPDRGIDRASKSRAHVPVYGFMTVRCAMYVPMYVISF